MEMCSYSPIVMISIWPRVKNFSYQLCLQLQINGTLGKASVNGYKKLLFLVMDLQPLHSFLVSVSLFLQTQFLSCPSRMREGDPVILSILVQ